MSLSPRDVLKRSLRLLGVLAAGDDPGADDLTDAMTALNTLKGSLFGTEIGQRLSVQDLTGLTAAQAEAGGEYAIPAVAFTLTAPGKPRAGDRFGITDPNLVFGASPLTINRNGRLLNGAASNLSVSVAGAHVRFWYRGDTGNWVEEADFATPDDVIEFPDALIAYLPYMLAVALAPEFGADLRPDIAALAAEGRAAFARAYGRRGRLGLDPSFAAPGVGQPQQASA
jgi:hypothetical protein